MSTKKPTTKPVDPAPAPAPKRAPLKDNVTDAEIKDLFLGAGFTLKQGFDDLMPYMYVAARAVIATALNKATEDKE